VLSNISHGDGRGPSWPGLTLTYVGRGTEDYRIAGRHYRVDEHQLLISPQWLGSEIAVARKARAGTLGLCVFLPGTGDVASLLDGPIVLPARSDLGSLMGAALRVLDGPLPPRDAPACVARRARDELDRTLLALDAQVESVAGLKRRTRFHSVRKIFLARAYLDKHVDRSVALEELAREVEVSPFQLLRSFRECVGDTPAAYHRRLRLALAKSAAESSGKTYALVADRFGFAGVSSFSRAYKRAFGVPPVRALRGAPRRGG
jgi:AraC-like DNA-binding protein